MWLPTAGDPVAFSAYRLLIALVSYNVLLSTLTSANNECPLDNGEIVIPMSEDRHCLCGVLTLASEQNITLFQNGILSESDYDSVHMGKLEGATLSVVDPANCKLEICGYNNGTNISQLSVFKGKCEQFSNQNFLLPKEYNKNYFVSSMSCACNKDPERCMPTCAERLAATAWTDFQCAMLFQEENCASCTFNSILLEHGRQFDGRNSYAIKSVIVRPGCTLRRTTYGNTYKDGGGNMSFDSYNARLALSYYKISETFKCFCDLDRVTTTTPTTVASVQSSKTGADITTTSLPDESPNGSDGDSSNNEKARRKNVLKYILLSVFVVVVLLATVFIIFAVKKWRASATAYPNLKTDGVSADEEEKELEMDEYSSETVLKLEYPSNATQRPSVLQVNKSQDEIMTELKRYIDYLVETSKKDEQVHLVSHRNYEHVSRTTLLEHFRLVCDPLFELSRDNIQIGKLLGSGHFGDVFKGTFHNDHGGDDDGLPETVAVKTLKSHAKENVLTSFLREIKIYQCVGVHENIVEFVGGCCHKGELLIVTKLCERGSLKAFLVDEMRPRLIQRRTLCKKFKFESSSQDDDDENSYRDLEDFSSGVSGELFSSLENNDIHQLLCWCEQIANGMEFLNMKQIIHVDLAVRNILLTEDLRIKICDFGLSKRCLEEKDYAQSVFMGEFPVNSLAPECTKVRANHQSGRRISVFIDIWAYGCTIWELFTLGDRPYQGMNALEVIQMLTSGRRLSRPVLAPDVVWEVLLECWNDTPEERPSFSYLRDVYRTEAHKLRDEMA